MGRPQEGNAAWRAAAMQCKLRPGNIGRKQCNYIKRNGIKCKALAIRNWHRCFMHGGAAVLARRGLYVARRHRHGRFRQRKVPEKNTT